MNNVLLKMQTAQTENGALSYATTGSACLDYWSKCGTLGGRSQDLVNADMERIFAEDENAALKIVFGMRLITRKPDSEEVGDDISTGYGRRDEFYKAVVWMHYNRNEMLYRNLHLIPMFGSWKDFLNEPLISVLNRNAVFEMIAEKFAVKNDPNCWTFCSELLRKFLPQIRSEKNIRSNRDRKRVIWAKDFCKHFKLSPKEYRQLKSSGSAHIWQKQMGHNEWDKINFNGIPGKAMLLHTSQTGKDKKTVFERHDLVPRMIDWLKEQKTVKFTGYPYELTKAAAKNPSLVQKLTYDRQFESLLETMKGHSLGNTLACLDTSGSMQSESVAGVSAYDVCISMGLVFSALNVGDFKDAVVAFDESSRLIRLNGTFCERFNQIRAMTTAWGSTNFQSVIDLMVHIRETNPNIPISEYPETLIVISDMQFNPVRGNSSTNYEEAMKRLRSVGLNDVRIIWWQVNGRTTDFPAQMNDKGVYMIGGFDPTNIKALMGLSTSVGNVDFNAKEKKEQTPQDGMKNFLSQPIFQLLS